MAMLWLFVHLSYISFWLMFPPTQGSKLGVFVCMTTQHVTLLLPKNRLLSEMPPYSTSWCINHLIPSFYGKVIFSFIFSPVKWESWFPQTPSGLLGSAVLLPPFSRAGKFSQLSLQTFLVFLSSAVAALAGPCSISGQRRCAGHVWGGRREWNSLSSPLPKALSWSSLS